MAEKTFRARRGWVEPETELLFEVTSTDRY